MTEDDIIDLADKAGSFSMIQYGVTSAKIEWLQKFADLVAEREREECAKIVEFYLRNYPEYVTGAPQEIRSRSEK